MKLFEGLTRFEDKDGVECFFVKTIKDRVLIWKKVAETEYICGELNYADINEPILSDAGLWNAMPDTLKTRIQNAQAERANEMQEREAINRKKRRSNNSDLPKTLTCAYGHEVNANWSVLNKKADKLDIPAIDLANNYKCQKCNPTKGRKKKSV